MCLQTGSFDTHISYKEMMQADVLRNITNRVFEGTYNFINYMNRGKIATILYTT